MVKPSKEERAKQLYLQASKAHKKGSAAMFNSPFTVPAELLYWEVCTLDTDDERRHTFRQIFDARLTKMIEAKKDFDYEHLSSDIVKVIERKPQSEFTVYFGVPIKKSPTTPLPFGKSITLDGVTFQHMSHQQFKRAHDEKCLNEYHRKCEEHLAFKDDPGAVMRNFYYFCTTIQSFDETIAANVAANAFELLYVCASAAQCGRLYQHHMGTIKTKSRLVIEPPGILLVSADKQPECSLFWTADVRMKSDAALDFTKNEARTKRFHLYKRICQENSPVSKRIRLLLFEFAKALGAEEPHIRQLGLWRCLEVGTGKDGGSRPEKEIVQILSNYYKDTAHWPQQGGVVKDIRNKFVHQGASLERDSWGSVDKYLNWTQEYVDSLLAILLWARKSGLKTADDIDDFFDLYSKPDHTLKIAQQMLKARTKALS